MRTAIILGRKHGGKTMELVHGTEKPIHEQLPTFKAEFCRSEIHEEFEYVELWTSDEGMTKRRKLISPKRAKEIAEAQAKAEAAAKAAAAKAAAEAKKKEKPAAEAQAKAEA
jgi:hypothetical protein